MTASKVHLTFEEYLNYSDDTDNRYELVDGELVEMPPENPNNCLIARFLFVHFLQFFPLSRVCMKDTEVEVSGRRAKTRFPDMMVLSETLEAELQGKSRNTITRDMSPPLIVVEIVSPGQENEDRDYRYKRSEYAARGIPEYWIVDPEKKQVAVLTLVTGLYEEAIFRGVDAIVSLNITNLKLTPEQIFTAGN